MKLLYANGDSWTEGDEIPKKYPLHCDTETYYNTWPWFLAQKLNIPMVINEGQGAGSNQRIHRRTTDFVFKYLGENKNPSDLLIVVGWTTPERFEFCLDGQYVKFNINDPLFSPSGKSVKKDIEEYNKLSYMHMDINLMNESTVRYMVNLRTLCKSFGIKYYDFVAVGLMPYIYENIAKEKYNLPLDNMYQLAWNDACNIFDWGRYEFKHPNIETHEKWSEKLMEFMQ